MLLIYFSVLNCSGRLIAARIGRFSGQINNSKIVLHGVSQNKFRCLSKYSSSKSFAYKNGLSPDQQNSIPIKNHSLRLTDDYVDVDRNPNDIMINNQPANSHANTRKDSKSCNSPVTDNGIDDINYDDKGNSKNSRCKNNFDKDDNIETNKDKEDDEKESKYVYVEGTYTVPSQNRQDDALYPINFYELKKVTNWIQNNLSGLFFDFNLYSHLPIKDRLEILLSGNNKNDEYSFQVNDAKSIPERLERFEYTVKAKLSGENPLAMQDAPIAHKSVNIMPSRLEFFIRDFFFKNMINVKDKHELNEEIIQDDEADISLQKIMETVKKDMESNDLKKITKEYKKNTDSALKKYTSYLYGDCICTKRFLFVAMRSMTVEIANITIKYQRILETLPNQKKESLRVKKITEKIKRILIEYIEYKNEGSKNRHLFVKYMTKKLVNLVKEIVSDVNSGEKKSK